MSFNPIYPYAYKKKRECTCSESHLKGKKSKLQRYYVTNYLKIVNLYFTSLIMIQISGNSPILVKYRNIYQKTCTNCSWNFFNSAYRKLLNLKLSRNYYNSIKSLIKALKLLKLLKYRGLKETRTSYEQKFGFTDNQRQIIWQKVRRSSKIG